jgi:hypothetical protein
MKVTLELGGEEMARHVKCVYSVLLEPGAWTRRALARNYECVAIECPRMIRERGASFSLLGAIEKAIEDARVQRAVVNEIANACVGVGWGRNLHRVNEEASHETILAVLRDAEDRVRDRQWRLDGWAELPDGPVGLREYDELCGLWRDLGPRGLLWQIYTVSACCGDRASFLPTLREDVLAHKTEVGAWLIERALDWCRAEQSSSTGRRFV